MSKNKTLLDHHIEEYSDSSEDEDPEDLDDILETLEVQELEDDLANEVDEPYQDDQNDNHGWTEYCGRHKQFVFSGPQGLKIDLDENSTPLDIFSLIVDDEIISHIVTETNKYAQQKIRSSQKTKGSRINQWTATNNDEIKKFLGLTMWMGLVRLSTLSDYGSTRSIYNLAVPRALMSRNRYQLLLSMVHFNDNKTIVPGKRLGKIKPLVDILKRKFQNLFCPGEFIVIDETLVPWRGRLIFRQYIPNKAHRYGIKLFKLCSVDGYTWDLKIYSGKSASGERETGLAKNVCMELLHNLLDQGRTLYVDNFYRSYELAKALLSRKTHVVGTVRSSKKDLPKEVF
ncbi:piggyBac transposable element-derived protein 4-like [Anthonomus grandis grandis]|uniref:piggyBac transposable element-derived protein 4-like n=1 Tax=Anthonomus grandis grandis TaxID=2921223 RepID=UPI00216595DA|nr:piggyBac transposable element-derived protein 4-like [Anthonomus grandis grandis]